MQTINYHLMDGLGVYIATVQIDPMAALPGRGTLSALPPEEPGKTRMWDGQQWQLVPDAEVPPVPSTIPPIAARQAAALERIKTERDRRKCLGVKVGDHWYHSDADSRIQQLSLFVMGAAVPPVQWKTLTLSHPPVFVTMTQVIAGGIFQGTAASDAAIFAAAEVHRVAMEASSTPESYDISTGWPVSIEDKAL